MPISLKIEMFLDLIGLLGDLLADFHIGKVKRISKKMIDMVSSWRLLKDHEKHDSIEFFNEIITAVKDLEPEDEIYKALNEHYYHLMTLIQKLKYTC